MIGPAECADRGEDYGGGRRHAKTGKIWKKWKTEIEAKDGEKNLEDPARRLARRPGGGGSLRAFRRAIASEPWSGGTQPPRIHNNKMFQQHCI